MLRMTFTQFSVYCRSMNCAVLWSDAGEMTYSSNWKCRTQLANPNMPAARSDL